MKARLAPRLHVSHWHVYPNGALEFGESILRRRVGESLAS